MTFWTAFWKEIETPSNQVGPIAAAYRRATSAIGHALLGASIASLLSQWWGAGLVIMQIAVVLAYWTLKERGDLRRGGDLADGLEDAAMVGIGTFYVGPWEWPLVVLLAALYVMWRGYRAS